MTETDTPKNSLSFSTIIDLSQPLAEELPTTWPGHLPYQHRVWNWYASSQGISGDPIFSVSPYYTRYIMIDEHTGTHFDAPAHFIPPPDSGLPAANALGAITNEQVPLEQLQGPAVVVDVTDVEGSENGVSPWLTSWHLQRWEAQYGSLEPGEVLLLKTGWDRYYTTGAEGEKYMLRPAQRKDFPGWPAPSVDLVEYALSKGIRCLGMDVPSIGAAHDGVPAHQVGLGGGLLYIESLTNLDKLPVRGSYFVFLPVKIARGSGGPGRAIAYV
jgi:kynurenine formamidase